MGIASVLIRTATVAKSASEQGRRWEYVQVLRLLEAFRLEEVAPAI
jgi:hypothetical protein